jgi:hypothetical protein
MASAPPNPALSPDWLAHRYDPGQDAVHFINVPRNVRHATPFLTDRDLPDVSNPVVVRRRDALIGVSPARLNFIFHSAYCGSTLVANAYDRPGRSFALKEPAFLNDMVGWRLRGGEPQQVGEVLVDGLTLLARPFQNGEVGVIKPSNLVNGLARAMLTFRPDSSALLLYAPLRQFLGSIAGKGLWGRLWVRDLLSKYLQEGFVDLDFTPQDYFMQSDLQVAAIGWLAQHKLFAALAKTWPDRVRTLDTPRLLANPMDSLEALDTLFGVVSDASAREAVVASIFSRHSKTGTKFSAAERASDQRDAADLHGDEIEKVVAWAEAVAAQSGIHWELPHPLL